MSEPKTYVVTIPANSVGTDAETAFITGVVRMGWAIRMRSDTPKLKLKPPTEEFAPVRQVQPMPPVKKRTRHVEPTNISYQLVDVIEKSPTSKNRLIEIFVAKGYKQMTVTGAISQLINHSIIELRNGCYVSTTSTPKG